MKKNNEMIGIAKVASLTSFGERTIWQLVEDGKMPSPVKLGARLIRWKRKDILDWMAWNCPSAEEFSRLRTLFLEMCRQCDCTAPDCQTKKGA